MSNNRSTQRIRVQVEGDTLEMRVRPADEPRYRDAATELKLTIKAYKDKYPNPSELPSSGYLMMAGLDIAYRAQLLSERVESRTFVETLSALNREIEELLSTPELRYPQI